MPEGAKKSRSQVMKDYRKNNKAKVNQYELERNLGRKLDRIKESLHKGSKLKVKIGPRKVKKKEVANKSNIGGEIGHAEEHIDLEPDVSEIGYVEEHIDIESDAAKIGHVEEHIDLESDAAKIGYVEEHIDHESDAGEIGHIERECGPEIAAP